MNGTKRLGRKIGFVLCTALLGALTGYTTYGQPSVSVGVRVPLPSVEIRVESDFYEPLTPYGRWEVVGPYGRCWIPGRVEADWRPYSEGYWQRTDDGWYWVSDEPWAWATYHYGRWNLSAQFGWYWVPQTQWAPAWVSWHSGGGYIGWAPLYPSDVRIISPQAYVFVEERHFMEPVSRSTVVVNNTTIINKTVINEAPATAAIEKASGRKVQAVAVQELRHKEEAPVVARQRTPTATSEKTVAAHESPQVEKPAAATHESVKPTPAVAEFKLEAKPEGNRPAVIKEPTGQNANKQPVNHEKSVQPSDQKEQPPAANEQNGPNPADKDHEDKVKE
jgi:hypothetical protein